MPAGKRIRYYRSDSASYQADLFNQLEEDGVKYAITPDEDKAVKLGSALIADEDRKEPVRGCGYEIAETVHCMNETKKASRLVVKRWVPRQGELFEKGGAYVQMGENRDGNSGKRKGKGAVCPKMKECVPRLGRSLKIRDKETI
jgi:hypothetical protein